MATSILIKYVGFGTDAVEAAAVWPVCRTFTPTGSYIDSPVYREGLTQDDKEVYGKSVYATNVDGWGTLPGLLPMANTTTAFAQFELAVKVAAEAKAAGTENAGITFEVEDYKDEIYWKQMAANMVDQKFYVKVGDAEYGEDTSADSTGAGEGTATGDGANLG